MAAFFATPSSSWLPPLTPCRKQWRSLSTTVSCCQLPEGGSDHEPLILKRVCSESLRYESGYLGGISERTRPPPNWKKNKEDVNVVDGGMSTYLTNILSSKVYDVAIESPLQYATWLSKRIGVEVWLKREDLQPGFSYKIRGAYNMMAKLSKEELDKGVICSSAGNHAQCVALAAQRLKSDAVIAMPVTTPDIEWRSVERLGAQVVFVGDSYEEAQAYAKHRAQQEGRTFIPPFDHPDVIAGQGTVGMEIIRQLRGPLHAIFVPVTGGGLIAGIAAYVKKVRPEVKIIGVEPSNANAMALSLYHGQRVILEKVGGFADGVAVKEVGEETFRLCRELTDGVVLVNRTAICASAQVMFEEKRSFLEPAGALALAGMEAYCEYYGLKGESVVAITSEADMYFDSLRSVTEPADVGRKCKAVLATFMPDEHGSLNFDRPRLVTELADVGRKHEAVLATYMPEEHGSLKQFCELIGPINISEFKYRCDLSKNEAFVFYSIGVHTGSELEAMVARLESSHLRTIDLKENYLAYDNLPLFQMGGLSYMKNELLCRFLFPEHPGALMKFMNAFSPRWNISLFHYRAKGEGGANVLAGIQVPGSEMDDFRDRADELGFEYAVDTKNAAYIHRLWML